MQETSTKPYLLRALHEWCMDNGYTPYIAVTIDSNTVVPFAHAQDGQITLNLSTLATNGLLIGNEYIQFQARFSGAIEDIFVPIGAVSAIYARETGTGMGFEVAESAPYSEEDDSMLSNANLVTSTDDPKTNKSEDPKQSSGRPSHLKVIK